MTLFYTKPSVLLQGFQRTRGESLRDTKEESCGWVEALTSAVGRGETHNSFLCLELHLAVSGKHDLFMS